MAVVCAAMFVPFFVFLKPSIPQDLVSFTEPAESVTVKIVLLWVTLTLHIGRFLYGTPSNK